MEILLLPVLVQPNMSQSGGSVEEDFIAKEEHIVCEKQLKVGSLGS